MCVCGFMRVCACVNVCACVRVSLVEISLHACGCRVSASNRVHVVNRLRI